MNRYKKEYMKYVLETAVLPLFFTSGAIAFDVYYFNNDKVIQVCDEYTDLNDDELYINNNGEYCKTFEEGEHILKVSRNDVFNHQYEEIEGYTIKSVETKLHRYHTEVTYINDEDIIAIGELDKNNMVEFNDFGKVKKLTK